MPYVSVVLPTYNRLEQLKRVLAGLENQTYPLDQFEVLVVSDGSTDGTNEYLQFIQTPLKIRSLFQDNQGVAATRNHGVQYAQGEIVLFVDDDVVPIPQLIEKHLQTHEISGANVVVIGPMLPPPGFRLSAWVQWGQDRLGEQYEAMMTGQWEATARQFYTGNTSLARKILLDYGGFDPKFRRAEDVELAYRLQKHGIRFFFCPDAIGYHYEERSFQSWLAIPYAYGRNDVLFTYQKENTWLLPKIFEEFHARHPFTRALIYLCLGRPVLSKFVAISMKQMMETSYNLHIPVLPRLACSTLFNLYHYQGIVDELGSTQQFFDGVRGKTIASPYVNSK